MWYPISWLTDGTPALFACGAMVRCIETRVEKKTKQDKTTHTPVGGWWGVPPNTKEER